MTESTKLYIDGTWVDPDPEEPPRWITIVNPATEKVVAQVAAGSALLSGYSKEA